MTIRRAAPCLLLVVALARGAVACSSSSDAPSGATDAGACPQDLPQACPTPPPSFQADVHDIVTRRCGSCHTDGGVAAPSHDFSSYAAIYRQRSAVLNQVYACKMPLPDAGQPTAEERAQLLGWLVCGAPNN